MATNSIYNSIKVKDKATCQKLVRALETTSRESGKDVTFSRPVDKMTKDEIRKVFK